MTDNDDPRPSEESSDSPGGPMAHLIEKHGIKPWLIHDVDRQHKAAHRRGADHEH